MTLRLRHWEPADEPFLWDMLYLAIHVPDGHEAPPRSVLEDPSIGHYLVEFGSRFGDDAVVAWDEDVAVGAAFCRRFDADYPSYGFVSDDIPEVGMAVLPKYRGRGIGRALLTELLDRHPVMSLSVDIDNIRACALYESMGFFVVRSGGTSVTMVRPG